MSSVNKVILLGNCGRDPEMRYLPSGAAVCNLSIATSHKYKDGNGQVVEDTQWHRLTFFERLAEIAGEYVKKGSSIYVEGRLKYGSYEKDGVKHYTTEIVVTSLQLLGGRREDQGGDEQPQRQQGGGQQRSQGQQRQPSGNQGGNQGGYGSHRGGQRQDNQRSAAPAQQPRQPSSGFDDMDDDIPF